MTTSIIFGLVGLVLILTRGEIFNFLRNAESDGFLDKWKQSRSPVASFVHALFSCPQCSGFWVGLFGSAIMDGCGLLTVVYGGLVSVLSMGLDLFFSVLARNMPRPGQRPPQSPPPPNGQPNRA